jgi:hypothetical protein
VYNMDGFFVAKFKKISDKPKMEDVQGEQTQPKPLKAAKLPYVSRLVYFLEYSLFHLYFCVIYLYFELNCVQLFICLTH